MTLLARLPGRAELVTAAVGMVLTALTVAAADRQGAQTTLVYMLGLATFAGVVAGFLLAPHVLVALTIVYFALLPVFKTFASPTWGGTKDLITAAALVAAGLLLVRRRSTRLDSSLLVLLALLFGLYLVNIGGALTGETGHGIAWFHGVRLLAEPVGLFVAGTSVRNPTRTLNWGVVALLGVCVLNGLFGLLQQVIGVDALLAAGYSYGQEVREISGQLRSFGTLDEPFAYAGLLLLGLASLFLWFRRSVWTMTAFAIIGLGLTLSYVRTAAVIVVALAAIAAARRGYGRYAALLMLAAAVAGALTFAAASQRNADRFVQVNPTIYLTLNGRTNIWKSTLDSPTDWFFGRGVGATGTASQRATRGLTGSAASESTGGTVVDSSYFAAIGDVGVIGLLVLLALFARVLAAASSRARLKDRSGWLAIGLVAVMLLDALTRESLVGFPTAYITMLLVGVAWAVWATEPRPIAASVRTR
jgi:hypothetical protein